MPAFTLDGDVLVDITIQNPPAITFLQGNVASAEIFVAGPQGPKGNRGTIWHSGIGAPAGTLGVLEDFYLDTDNGDVYEKTGEFTWTLTDNLTGRAATDTAQTWTRPQTFAMGVGADIPLTIRSHSSGTANLTEWQNNAGTTLARIGPTGGLRAVVGEFTTSLAANIIAPYTGSELQLQAPAGATQLKVRSDQIAFLQPIRPNGQNPAAVPMVVRGEASQSADLTQWQNSLAQVVASISNIGDLLIAQNGGSGLGKISLGNSSHGVARGAALNANAGTNSVGFFTAGGLESGFEFWHATTGLLFKIQGDTRAASLAGNLSFTGTNGVEFNGGTLKGAGAGYVQLGENLLVSRTLAVGSTFVGSQGTSLYVGGNSNSVVGDKTIVARAIASQTGDIQQWQNSAGTALASVSSSGGVASSGPVQIGLSGSVNPKLILRDDSATESHVSETAVGTIDFLGHFGLNPMAQIKVVNTFGTHSYQSGEIVMGVGANSGAAILDTFRVTADGIRVRQRSGGVGSLQQWQNSAGVSLANVTASGNFGFTAALYGNGKMALKTDDSFLRINQGAEFTSGVWFGSSTIKMGDGPLLVGSNGGEGNVGIIGNSADGGTRRITIDGGTGNVTASGVISGASGYYSGNMDASKYSGEAYSLAGHTDFFNVNTLYATAAGSVPHYGVGKFDYDEGTGTTGTNTSVSGYFGISMVTNGFERLRVARNGTVQMRGAAEVAGILYANGRTIVGGGTGTGYGTADLEVASGRATGPVIALHWTGSVASTIGVLSDGTVVVRNNPGTGYEKFRAAQIDGSAIFDNGNRVYSAGNPAPYPVTSVAGRTGDIILTSTDVSGVVATTGAQSIAGIKTFTDAPVIQGISPTLRFQDTDQTGGGINNAWWHLNSGQFYLLVDNNNDGLWEGTYPILVRSDLTVNFAVGVFDNNNRVYSAVNPVPVSGLSATGTRDATTFLRGDNTWATLNISNMVTTDTVQTITGQKTFSTAAVGTVNMVVKSIASQTADLQQWTNSAGTVMLAVANGGYLASNGSHLLASTSQSTTLTLLTSQAANQNPLVVKGAASQTADLTQWQTSAGAKSSYVSSGGSFIASGASLPVFMVGTDVWLNAEMNIKTYSGTRIGAVIRGSASQTSDFMQFQDSAGNVLARVANDGTIYKGSTAVGGNAADTEIMAIMGAF